MRKCREIIEGAIYETYDVVNRHYDFLDPFQIKKLLINVIEFAKESYDFVCYHYSINNNEMSLIIKPGKKGNISKIMQFIKSAFAKLYNKLTDGTGHVWRQRFKSRIIKYIKNCGNF